VPVLRPLLLSAARNSHVRDLIRTAPVSRSVVRRFIAGDTVDQALTVARRLVEQGLAVSLDRLGEDTSDVEQAKATTQAYVDLLARIADDGLAERTEVSVKLSGLGQALDEQLARDHAAKICAPARDAGTPVTLDMEDHTTTTSTLRVVHELRGDFPWLGAVLQAYLRRTADDALRLVEPGSRVRLCKGAYAEPAEVAFQSRGEVDRAYVRALVTLMSGRGYPMIATHDPRLIAITDMLAQRYERERGSYEYQMLYGIRPVVQKRIADRGYQMRVYIPYGDQWYGYLMRRLAERPANVAFFARALASRD
jgi:proline dehydrogenase